MYHHLVCTSIYRLLYYAFKPWILNSFSYFNPFHIVMVLYDFLRGESGGVRGKYNQPFSFKWILLLLQSSFYLSLNPFLYFLWLSHFKDISKKNLLAFCVDFFILIILTTSRKTSYFRIFFANHWVDLIFHFRKLVYSKYDIMYKNNSSIKQLDCFLSV